MCVVRHQVADASPLRLDIADQLDGRHTERGSNVHKFDRVQTPFAGFILRDELLTAFETVCERELAEPHPEPRLTERGDESLIPRIVNAARQCASAF